MTEELKPCPFCGGSAIDCGKDDICCTTPGCAMSNKYIPLKEWNTRAEPAPLPDEAYDISSKFSKRNAGELIAYCDEILSGKNEIMPGVLRAHIAALTKEIETTKQTAVGHYLTWQCTEAGLREQIAALESENKRLRDALDSIKSSPDSKPLRDMTIQEKAMFYQDWVMKSLELSVAALAQPEPQKCGTCGGRGWKSNNVDEYTRTGRSSIDCPDCNGTGKAGA